MQKTRACFILLSGGFFCHSIVESSRERVMAAMEKGSEHSSLGHWLRPKPKWSWRSTMGKSMFLGMSNAMFHSCYTYSEGGKGKVDCAKSRREKRKEVSCTLKYLWKQSAGIDFNTFLEAVPSLRKGAWYCRPVLCPSKAVTLLWKTGGKWCLSLAWLAWVHESKTQHGTSLSPVS